MKKIIFLLLLSVAGYGQATNFPYGIKNAAATTDSTPAYFTTSQVDGVHKKTPAANIEKTANKSDSYTTSSSTTYASTKALVDGLAATTAEITPEMFGAVGDGVADDAPEIQDAIDFLETKGGTLRLKSGSTYRINSTIILPSNITIIGYGSTIELGANSVQMFVTKGFVGGVRTENITFLGGTYDGGVYGGVPLNGFRFIFHKSDRITIKDINFNSLNSAHYMVVLADTKDVSISDCNFITAKDGIHLIGKNYNTKIDNIYGVTGDDLIAVTTKDYAGIDFEEGDVQGLYIKNIVCDNATRAVLLGNTHYTIKDVYIDNVEQLGTGALMNIGDAGTSETGVLVDNVIIKNTKVNNVGSQLLLRHRNLGKITIENTNAEIYVGREEAFGFANIDHLIVNKGTALFMEEHVVVSRVIELSGMTQKIQIGGTTDLFSLKNSTISTTSNLVIFTGLTKNALISNCILKSSYTGNDATLFFKDVINNIVVENSELQSGSTLSPLFLGNDSNSIINKLTYYNCKINQVSRIYNTNYVGVGNTEINISNTNITNANRLIEDSSSVEFVIKYDNINIGSTLNRPFNFYNNQVVSVYGNGYQGTQDTFDSNSNVLCYAQDFPINVGAISYNNKSRAYNTNAGLSCGVGLVANDSTGWFKIATNTVSPKFTGTPTAPTATVGTNTTQIATTAFVQAVDAGNVKTTGDQTKTGNLTLSGDSRLLSVVSADNETGYAHLGIDALGLPYMQLGTSSNENTAVIRADDINTNSVYQLPNSSGTIALQETVKPYKVYTALLSQTGTDAPTATVLENTLGGTVVWTRKSTALYTGTLAGAFTANKTWTSITSTATGTVTGAVSASVDSVTVATSYLDSALTNSAIEIRVYN